MVRMMRGAGLLPGRQVGDAQCGREATHAAVPCPLSEEKNLSHHKEERIILPLFVV